MRWGRLFLASCALVLAVSAARAFDEVAAYHDSLRADVPISASTLLGFSSPSAKESLSSVAILTPQAYEGRICLRLASRDGRYQGQGLYRLYGAARHVIPLSTENLTFLRIVNPVDVAALAYEADTCGDDPKVIFPVLLNGEGRTVNLIFNSGGGRVIAYLKDANGFGGGSICRPMAMPRSIAYDTGCPVALDSLGGHLAVGVDFVIGGRTSRKLIYEFPQER